VIKLFEWEFRDRRPAVGAGKTGLGRITKWSTSLRILVLYANPVTASFGATLHREVVKTLRSRGHEIDDCDLYAERFDPVLSEQERMQYHDLKLNRAHIDTYADRLLAAEALILVYPVWNEGFPAILKGFFDRVFIPGVSFTVGPDGALVTNLQKLRRIAAVCTYGATRTINVLLGDPPRRVVKRLVRWMPGHRVRCDYLAYYGMDQSTQEQRAAFQVKVKRTFEAW
jgi:NAD(P)H dehydrogenase (quinone)